MCHRQGLWTRFGLTVRHDECMNSFLMGLILGLAIVWSVWQAWADIRDPTDDTAIDRMAKSMVRTLKQGLLPGVGDEI